jgi:hypothetical protein
MKLTDSHSMILERLIEAMETDDALPVSIGPKMFGSSMPEYVHTVAEENERKREDYRQTGGFRIREDEAAERRRTERRARCSRARISRMEEAFAWVQEAVPNERNRKCLLAYALVKARGWDWSRYVTNRNRRFSTEKAWVRQKTYEWIGKSLQQIEKKFLQTSLPCMEAPDLQTGQIGPESTGKSIRSDLRSWIAPDGKPSYRRTA